MKMNAQPGDRYGMLTFVRLAPEADQPYMALFLCDCGTEKLIAYGNVVPGNTVSCGCQRAGQAGDLRRTHGQSDTPLYQCWKDMKERSTAGSRFQQLKPTYAGVGRDPSLGLV